MVSTTWSWIIDKNVRKRAEKLLTLVKNDDAARIDNENLIPLSIMSIRDDQIVLIALLETMMIESNKRSMRMEFLLLGLLAEIGYLVFTK